MTDKDELESKIIIDMVGGNSEQWREIRDVIAHIRAESADQARKEAAERAVRFFDDFRICVPPNKYNMPQETLDQLRATIIGDSVIKENLTTDHKYDCAAYATEELKEYRKIKDLYRKEWEVKGVNCRERYTKMYHGHGHRNPGLWDGDNGKLAGCECAACLLHNAALKEIQGC